MFEYDTDLLYDIYLLTQPTVSDIVERFMYTESCFDSYRSSR